MFCLHVKIRIDFGSVGSIEDGSRLEWPHYVIDSLYYKLSSIPKSKAIQCNMS